MKIHFPAQLPVLIPLVATLSLPLGSCNATSGAATGALLGAGLGQLAGGDTESTLIGAAIGAGIGAAIGYNVAQKREARVLESRRASAAELEAANRKADAVSASAREKAIALAKAYEAEHADEYENPGRRDELMAETTDVAPMEPAVDPAPTPMPDASDEVTETPLERAAETPADPGPELPAATPREVMTVEATAPVLVEAVRLPDGKGVVFKDLETGEFIDEEVHVIEDIQDVSGKQPKPISQAKNEEPKPFTLILSDKKSGKSREYTAIYSA